MKIKTLSRRTVLRGLGTCIALPFLEMMLPLRAFGQSADPKRVIYLTFGNGADMSQWYNNKLTGPLGTLGSSLAALEPHKSYVNVLSGLDGHLTYYPNNDHCASHFLVGLPAKGGAGLSAGISIDVAIAKALNTKSLVIGADDYNQEGKYYSYQSASTPSFMEMDPTALFNSLTKSAGAPMPSMAPLPTSAPSPTTQASAQQSAQRIQYNKSVLDFVLDDATRLQKQLGASDKARLDEYLTGIRATELQITGLPAATPSPTSGGQCSKVSPGTSTNYHAVVGIMYKLMAMALQCDLSRVMSFALNAEGSDQPYPMVNAPGSHHTDYSHHSGPQMAAIVGWHTQQLASFVNTLKNSAEGSGNILDNVVIVYGSELSQYASNHQKHDLPVVTIGKLGGQIATGNHYRFSNQDFYWGQDGWADTSGSNTNYPGTNLTNFHLTIAQMMGTGMTSFNGSDGTIRLK